MNSYALTTGYDSSAMPEAYRHAPLLMKPYDLDTLGNILLLIGRSSNPLPGPKSAARNTRQRAYLVPWSSAPRDLLAGELGTRRQRDAVHRRHIACKFVLTWQSAKQHSETVKSL